MPGDRANRRPPTVGAGGPLELPGKGGAQSDDGWRGRRSFGSRPIGGGESSPINNRNIRSIALEPQEKDGRCIDSSEPG